MRNSLTRMSMFAITSALVVACGGSSSSAPTANNGPPPPPAGTPNSVVITNNAFTPEALTTSSGSTVTWTWNSCSGSDGYGSGQVCTTHDIAFDDGSASGAQSSGTYARTFATTGTFAYHCRIHGAAMSGSVVVK